MPATKFSATQRATELQQVRHGDFIVPRGVTVAAGGYTQADARTFTMATELGADTSGIASNPFLNEAFRTVKYEVEITVHDAGSFSYAEDTVLAIRDRDEVFHHEGYEHPAAGLSPGRIPSRTRRSAALRPR